MLLALHPLPERSNSRGVCLGPAAGMFNLFLSLSFYHHSLPYFAKDDFSPEVRFHGELVFAGLVPP
jgi:hypothetical protein